MINLKRVFSWLIFEWHFGLFSKKIKNDDKPDVFIASSLSLLTFFISAILKRKFKCKLILEIIDIWPDTVIATAKLSNKNIFIKILKWIELYGYNKVDGFISTLLLFSDYLKTRIKNNFKFEFVPQGFDQDNLASGTIDKYKNEFYLGYFNVCYAGSIGKTNCVDEIIEIAKLLRGKKYVLLLLVMAHLKKCYKKNVQPGII